LIQFCRDTSHWVNQWEIMLETAHNHGLVCQKMRTDTSFLTANMSHSAFAESKTMETFNPDMSTYVKSCTWTRPRKSKWCRVISWSVVVVSRWDQSFFVVSRYFACEMRDRYDDVIKVFWKSW